MGGGSSAYSLARSASPSGVSQTLYQGACCLLPFQYLQMQNGSRVHETPAWLLTRYERPSPATSSGVGGAPAGSGPTPPESGRPSVPLSTGRTSFIPGSTRTDGGETPSPNSGAPDTSIRAQSEAVKENPLQAASARDREKLAKLKAKLKAERPPEEE